MTSERHHVLGRVSPEFKRLVALIPKKLHTPITSASARRPQALRPKALRRASNPRLIDAFFLVIFAETFEGCAEYLRHEDPRRVPAAIPQLIDFLEKMGLLARARCHWLLAAEANGGKPKEMPPWRP